MCGILAIISDLSIPNFAFIRSMKQLANRGPDSEGVWKDNNVVFGHRRLAIIDLDERSVQPMQSDCGKFVIVFNGEIYNYQELKSKLLSQGVLFKTESDTEVILNLFLLYKEDMLQMLKGMFSLIIWDKNKKEAFVARDPYGIKPLYFSILEKGIIIASTVSSIVASGLVNLNKSLYGQRGFYFLGSVPEPYTWFENILSVKSGSYFYVSNYSINKYRKYVDISDSWIFSSKMKYNVPFDSLNKQVKSSIEESISRHLVSDVPIGLFLSGGIDSGVLAGIISMNNKNNLIAITLKFDEFSNSNVDESARATSIANLYGIKHHIRVVTKEEFLNDFSTIIDDMDQPSIDGINTWYASKAASELGLKVVLSGVGGDELFFGYESFTQLPPLVKFWSRVSKIRFIFSMGMFFSILLSTYFKNKRWLEFPDNLKNILGSYSLKRGVLAAADISEILNTSFEKNDLSRFISKNDSFSISEKKLDLAHLESSLYLKNQLLRDSDWASMAHSVELRTPFVDFTLLKNLEGLLFSLSNYKNKVILSNVLTEPLPNYVLNSKKTGFGIPIKNWIGKSKESNYNFNKFWMQEIIKRYEEKCKKLQFDNYE
jgi:asparagine synthase (glutamine-hydrolysing)